MSRFMTPDDVLARLRTYESLLLKWQGSINLISPGTAKTAWERHFEDSLQLLPLIPKSIKTLYDLGSGAGFPGMVLAMVCPNLQVTLIESDSKKCAFLQTVSRETKTDIVIQNERIEAATATLPAPDMVTARALASLPELLHLCVPWIKENPSIELVFPKGAQWESEISEAKMQDWAFHVEQIQSKTDRAAQILILKKLQKA